MSAEIIDFASIKRERGIYSPSDVAMYFAGFVKDCKFIEDWVYYARQEFPDLDDCGVDQAIWLLLTDNTFLSRHYRDKLLCDIAAKDDDYLQSQDVPPLPWTREVIEAVARRRGVERSGDGRHYFPAHGLGLTP